jgi:hypothetical protein
VQATPAGRALELLFETAYGKYQTPAQLLEASRERMDPMSLAKAQVQLAADVGRGVFAESIRLAREGKFSEATGTALGQNADVFLGVGVLGKKGGKALRTGVEAEAGTAAARTEAVGRAVTEAGDPVRQVARGIETEAQVAAWKASLPAKKTPQRDARDFFEVRQTGPVNYLISGGGEEIWADGILISNAHALEAKFVRRPGRSPFVGGSDAPPFIRSSIGAEVDDEFRRYAAVIADRGNPLLGLEVITNDAAAVPYFESLMKRLSLKGRVIVRE